MYVANNIFTVFCKNVVIKAFYKIPLVGQYTKGYTTRYILTNRR